MLAEQPALDREALLETIADLICFEVNPLNATLRLAFLNKARAMEIARQVLELIERALPHRTG